MRARDETPRALSLAHQTALARERSAWEYLQHMRVAGTVDERRDYLQAWIEAMQAVRATNEQLTKCLMHDAVAGYRTWLDTPETALPTAAPAAAGQDVLLLGHMPRAGQRMRARDGSVWWVESVAQDAFDERQFLAHIRRGPGRDGPPDVLEIYGDDWPLVCRVHGLSPLDS